MPFRSLADQAEHLSYGMMAYELCPEVQAEDQSWRFLGIFSHNREEWYTLQIGCMYQGVTTVGIHTDICAQHFYHILIETELSTIAISHANLTAFIKFKENDTEGKMQGLKNIIWLEDKISAANKQKLEELGL